MNMTYKWKNVSHSILSWLFGISKNPDLGDKNKKGRKKEKDIEALIKKTPFYQVRCERIGNVSFKIIIIT